MKWTLREKCQNTEFFLLRIFPHSDWIRRGTEYLSLFCSIAGKYGPEKTPHLDTFHAVEMEWNQIKSEWNQAKVNAFQTTERSSSNYLIYNYQRWELFLQKYKNISYFHPWNSPLKINFWKSSSEFYQIIPLMCMNWMWECHKCIHNLFKLIR